MNEERLSILHMLSEGKITVEEAEELLKALEVSEKAQKNSEPQSSSRQTSESSYRSQARTEKGRIPFFDMGKMFDKTFGRFDEMFGKMFDDMGEVFDIGKTCCKDKQNERQR